MYFLINLDIQSSVMSIKLLNHYKSITYQKSIYQIYGFLLCMLTRWWQYADLNFIATSQTKKCDKD